jgi:hypothetical protein
MPTAGCAASFAAEADGLNLLLMIFYYGDVKVSTGIPISCKRASAPVTLKNRHLNLNAKDNQTTGYRMALAA